MIEVVATRFHILKLNALDSISSGALSQTPLEVLTALLQTRQLNLRGYTQ